MQFTSDPTKAGLWERCFGPTLRVRWASVGGERGSSRARSRLLPSPSVCCQMCPPRLKSRDWERWWAALPPIRGEGSYWRSQSVLLWRKHHPPLSCGTAEPRRPHLRVGKLRLGETREDSPGSFLHVQFPTILSWLVVTWLLVSV